MPVVIRIEIPDGWSDGYFNNDGSRHGRGSA
jgi:hypothetical protein